MTGWISEGRRPVAVVVAALGWTGDDRQGYPCPACGEAKRDRRGAAGVTRQGWGWRCHRCQEGGDGLDYLSWALFGSRLGGLDVERRRTLRDWLRAQGWLVGPVSPFQHVERPTAPQAPAEPPPPEYPPADEVAALWAETRPVREVEPVRDFLVERGLRPWSRALVEADLARAFPLSTEWPSWWPARRAATWRLVVQAWDARGVLRSLHARAVAPTPVVEGRALPKVLWPRGYESRGLLFACPAARALLRGESPELVALVLAEGLTDWLTLASWAQHTAGGRPAQVAVLGGSSGAWCALAEVAIPVDLDVVVAVDEDEAGDRYLLEIVEALGGRTVRRFSPSSLSRKAA